MTDLPVGNTPSGSTAPLNSAVDGARVRSLVGLVIARLGPRAFGVVSGTFLALLVGSQTKSLLAVTFALTAHRLLSIVTYPLIGRLSDGGHALMGRRLPYMAGGMMVMAVCTFLFPVAGGYWSLLALIVLARQARVAYTLPNIAATPEVFGRSRWLKALLAVGVGGIVVGTLVRLTVIATWERDDPSTWAPAFRLAAVFMVLGALALIVLVREAPATRQLETPPRPPWREELREVLAAPNAKVLGAAGLLTLAASGATDRVYPLYAGAVLGASGSDLAAMGFVAGPVTLIVGVPVGLWLAQVLTRRQLAVLAPAGGVIGALAHLAATTLWQSVLIGVITTPLLVACLVSFGPFAASLLPPSGGMTERIGIILGPIGLAGVAASYASAATYDHLVRDYRVIWVFSAVLTGVTAPVLLRLRVPPGQERADVKGMLKDLSDEASRRRTQRTRLFGGEITAHDVDTADFADTVRRIAMRYGYDDGRPGDPAPPAQEDTVPDGP